MQPNSDPNDGLKPVALVKLGPICKSLDLKFYRSTDVFRFSPFSGGPRICVGMPFANAEMSYILSRLFQTFTTLSTSQSELRYKMMILMVPSTEVHVSFIRKKNTKAGLSV